MAQSKSINTNSAVAAAICTSASSDEVKASATIFHDFLGKGSVPDSSPAAGPAACKVRPPSEASLSASASIGASSGGGRGPVSTTSDLGSERQAGNHFEGIPFCGPRSDFIGHEGSNRFAGTKRSNSDSYLGTTINRFPSVRPDSLDGSQFMKLTRHVGGERHKRPHDEEASFSTHLVRPVSASLVSQPLSGVRADSTKLDCGIPMNFGPPWQYPPRSSQVVPLSCQALSSKFIDSNIGPSVVSQGAADEGSRTGIKGSGLLSSVNTSGRISERNFSGALINNSKQKSGIHISEPESSKTLSQHGFTSAGCQMTIFYGGQAHVFDNVHPNKADVIMALAGSNGGSWSTNYVPKTGVKPLTGGNCSSSDKNNTGITGNHHEEMLKKEAKAPNPPS